MSDGERDSGAAGLPVGMLLRALPDNGGVSVEKLRSSSGIDQVDETIRFLRMMGMVQPSDQGSDEVELTADGAIARDLELSTSEHAFSLNSDQR